MFRIRKYFKYLLHSLKNKKKNVYIDKTCELSYKNLYLEGMNRLNKDSSIVGKIGYASYIGERSHINAVVGRYCSIASDVNIIGGVHPTRKFVSTHPAFYSTRRQAGFTYVEENIFEENVTVDNQGHLVSIGNDVWIGTGAMILPGIHIGDGAIIAAGAVVTKDVEPYTIVGGVPAKVLRKRFEQEQIEKLLEFKWWNKDETWIKKNAVYFSDIEAFMRLIDVNEKEGSVNG